MVKILLVDDDHDVRQSFGRILMEDGYRVESYSDGLSAADAFGKGNFDLVITDIQLPGMHGIDLIYHIREIDPEILVIAISGGDEDDFITLTEDLQTASKEGANLVIPKPCDEDYLKFKVRELLETKP